MTSKPPIVTVESITDNKITLVDAAAAAKSLIAYNEDVARCARTGYAPHPPIIKAIIRHLGRKEVTLRPGSNGSTKTTALGVRLTFDLVEYVKSGDPHKHGSITVMSERPDYDQEPDDTGD